MDADAERLLVRAREFLAHGNLPAAGELANSLAGVGAEAPAIQQLLGVVAGRTGNFAAAAEHFARAVALDPGQPEFHRNLGHARNALGQTDAAEASFRAAAELAPRAYEPLQDLGKLLWLQGRLVEAARVWEQALALQPLSAEARFSLGSILSSLGHQPRAVALLEELAQLTPTYPGLQLNLGLALMKQGRCAAAIACYDRAIAADPADYMAHNNLGNALREQQRMEEALASYRRALEIKPDHATAHSNLLLTLNYIEPSQQVIHRESLRFGAQQAADLPAAASHFRNAPNPEKVLRVGYVSADFRQHSVAYFIDGPFRNHDRAEVRVHCYANVAVPDSVTARLQSQCDEWTSISGLGDATVADRIRADGIDILVDLGGHTGGNRLLVFARRPAPVQVTWLGYPNTTGVPGIDYRLTDAVADPPGDADRFHSEELLRLPGGFLCYQPDTSLSGADLHVARRTGPAGLTLGSFNTLSKITPGVIRVWAQILQRLPEARLLLKSESLGDPETRGRFEALFAAHGVAAARLELIDRIADHREHLDLYSRVDMALDPFPYNGATTTFEALWMGVPVLSLEGNRHAGRVGASILSHANLPQWLATDEGAYVEMAVQRAMDRPWLAAQRSIVAARLRSSPLLDVHSFTRNLERAYRELWVRWCTGQR